METAQWEIGADMVRKVWCRCAHITLREGADCLVETGSGIKRRDGPEVTRREWCEFGRKTGKNAAESVSDAV